MSRAVPWVIKVWFANWDVDDVPDQDGTISLTEEQARDLTERLDRLRGDDLIGLYEMYTVEDLPAPVTIEGLKRILVSDPDDPEVVQDFEDSWNGVPAKTT